MRRTLVLMLLFAAGCTFEVDPCRSDDECPPQTRCMRPAKTTAPVCIAPDEVDADVGTMPVDMNDVEELDTSTSARDTREDDPDTPLVNSDPNECPQVDACGELEPNDTEDDAIFLTDFAEGCSGFGLENWSAIHQDQLCAEDVDQFIVEYVACEEGGFRITASLTTSQMCLDGGELEIAEGLYDCDDDNVRCEIEDGVQRIIVIIDEKRDPQPVEKIRFAVSPGIATAGVEYILRVTIGR